MASAQLFYPGLLGMYVKNVLDFYIVIHFCFSLYAYL
jgi:hypothetical protein